MRLFEVKYFEPPTDQAPAQIRYVNCWLESVDHNRLNTIWLKEVGREGRFAFVSGVCKKYLGCYRARIVGEISNDRYMEPDRFEETTAPF